MNERLSKEDIINVSNGFNRKPFVYFLINKEEIVYVGQSKGDHGHARIWSHKNKEFTSYSMIECDLSELDEIETDYIIKFKPRYNKVLNHPTKYISLSNLKIIYGGINLSKFFENKGVYPVFRDFYKLEDTRKFREEIKKYTKTEKPTGDRHKPILYIGYAEEDKELMKIAHNHFNALLLERLKGGEI